MPNHMQENEERSQSYQKNLTTKNEQLEVVKRSNHIFLEK